MKNIQGLDTGSFLENAAKIMFRLEKKEGFFILHQLEADGTDAVGSKKRKLENHLLEGLIKNKHFSISPTGRRITHGECEARFEFNKLTPKG